MWSGSGESQAAGMTIFVAKPSDRVAPNGRPGDAMSAGCVASAGPVAFPLGDHLSTVPNGVTLVRTVAAVVVGGLAIVWSEPWLLALAYAVYWVGDMLDGLLARRLGQETRLGAVLDIVSDRACTSLLCVGVIGFWPSLTIVVIPFFLSFMVLDTILSLAFLGWPILSPNYFGDVDRQVYRLNWSPPAKALNTAGVILLAVAGQTAAALTVVVVVAGIKIWSLARVQHLLRSGSRVGGSTSAAAS